MEGRNSQNGGVTCFLLVACCGWVCDPHARHSTMLYSMQEGALSSNSAEGLMKHGRASREAT